MRSGELKTSRDRYLRRAAIAAVATVILLAVIAGSAYRIYQSKVPRITVDTATYGNSCNGKTVEANGVPFSIAQGNATANVAAQCNGAAGSCNVTISGWSFSDPAPMCAKDFEVKWRCNGKELRVATLDAEAMGKTVNINCR